MSRLTKLVTGIILLVIALSLVFRLTVEETMITGILLVVYGIVFDNIVSMYLNERVSDEESELDLWDGFSYKM